MLSTVVINEGPGLELQCCNNAHQLDNIVAAGLVLRGIGSFGSLRLSFFLDALGEYKVLQKPMR